MSYLFTSESVSEGHPDKVADQISDALLDHFLAADPNSKVACETLVTSGRVVVAGEIKSLAEVDIDQVVRDVIRRIGYTKSEYCFDADSCQITNALHEQSPDINRGVDRPVEEQQGAGDQGIMFGYACNETDRYMPLSLDLAHCLLKELSTIRKETPDLMPYLRPDAKSQVTIEYSDRHVPLRIHTIVVSTQHDEFVQAVPGKRSQEEADRQMQERIHEDIKRIVIPRTIANYSEDVARLLDEQVKLYVNPTGKFVIGGPHGDTGLTGRKIIVDTYGGRACHGGGAFSGKDPSKVDRSAAYAARHIAKNMVAAGIADEILVQLSYAIGVAEPISIFVNTYGRSHVTMSDGEIAEQIAALFDLRPHAIERSLGLRHPIYLETASYGHMGREPKQVSKHLSGNPPSGDTTQVDLFTWERLDCVERIQAQFRPYFSS